MPLPFVFFSQLSFIVKRWNADAEQSSRSKIFCESFAGKSSEEKAMRKCNKINMNEWHLFDLISIDFVVVYRVHRTSKPCQRQKHRIYISLRFFPISIPYKFFYQWLVWCKAICNGFSMFYFIFMRFFLFCLDVSFVGTKYIHTHININGIVPMLSAVRLVIKKQNTRWQQENTLNIYRTNICKYFAVLCAFFHSFVVDVCVVSVL